MTKLTKQQQLALGIKIAVEAHDGQFDKGGKPYILHPFHLMNQLMFDTQLATIAVLHDVIEDSDYTIEKLRELGFSVRVCAALRLLTHVPDKEYLKTHTDDEEYLFVYIVGIGSNYDTIRVKRKDLGHNSCITRLKSEDVSDKDIRRVVKYHTAHIMLGKAKRCFESRR